MLVPGATPIELQALTGKLATLEAENAKMKAEAEAAAKAAEETKSGVEKVLLRLLLGRAALC